MVTKKDKIAGTIFGAALGDVIGYKNGNWEFCRDTRRIHYEYQQMGGLKGIDLKGWMVSDDTVMHIATIQAILKGKVKASSLSKMKTSKLIEKVMPLMANEYIECFDDMDGRGPGITCGRSIFELKSNGIKNWNRLSYSGSGGGCGGSMRAQAIGIYCRDHLKHLVGLSIESGRLTHNHPTGFLGAMVSALFTAYAFENKPVHEWPLDLMEKAMPIAKTYCKEMKRDWDQISNDIHAFEKSWNRYIHERKITRDSKTMTYPENWDDPLVRDAYYKTYSYNGWAGASGDDSVIIAYDCLARDHMDLEKLIISSALHAGDSDSTGTIALAWYGAMYGNVFPSSLLTNLEKINLLTSLGDQLATFC